MLRPCVLVMIASAAAAAEPSAQEQARALVRSAKTEFEAWQFERAAKLLEQAVELAPTPATLYNLGRAREKAGQLQGAIEAYRRYLDASPDAKDRGATQETIDELTRRIAEKQRLETLESQPPVIVIAPSPKRAPRAPWIVGGLGAAGIAAAVVLGALASNAHQSGVVEGEAFTAAAAQQRAQSFSLGANLAYAIGGAALVAGLLWWIFGGGA